MEQLHHLVVRCGGVIQTDCVIHSVLRLGLWNNVHHLVLAYVPKHAARHVFKHVIFSHAPEYIFGHMLKHLLRCLSRRQSLEHVTGYVPRPKYVLNDMRVPGMCLIMGLHMVMHIYPITGFVNQPRTFTGEMLAVSWVSVSVNISVTDCSLV